MHMYSLSGYGNMIADPVRAPAYELALRRAVKPGCVVLDVGTGVGIHALLACQLGARRVYAVEPNDAITVAREVAAVNGYGGSIEFIQAMSGRVTLPEPADVIVADLRGVLPYYPGNVGSIVDARKRLLAPGGVLIPQRDTLWAAVVQAPELYRQFVSPWEREGHGFDMRAARRVVTNTWNKGSVRPEQMLVRPQVWATLDYARVESADVRAGMTWTVSRAGTAHGLVAWFDATLIDGVGFSNAPGQPDTIYGRAFFPWPEPVDLAAGQTVKATLEAREIGDEYVWCWGAEVLDPGDATRVRARFRQSTFFGTPRSADELRKHEADSVPALNENGLIDRFILDQMDGRTSLGEIASRLSAQFPECFPTVARALRRAGDVATRLGK